MNKGAQLVLKTVRAIETGNYPQEKQNETQLLHRAPKIFKETCEINWNNSAQHLINFVRGLSPYPTAWTRLNEKVFKIYKIAFADYNKESAVGEISTDNKTYLYIKTADSWISILEFQPEGKKRMNVQEYFRGNKIN